MDSRSDCRSGSLSRREILATGGKALAGLAGLNALPSPAEKEQLSNGSPHPSTNMPGQLRVASCQFPVGAIAAENANFIRQFMHQAASQGAHLLHTSEACLTGYAGQDLITFGNYDWDALRIATSELQALARELKLYLVLGSAHFLDQATKPTNCVYLISPEGEILDRYDKSFLTKRDQLYYSAGNRRVVRDINGVRIGLAICYDVCWPQLYMAYRELGVSVMLHSMYNARDKGPNHLDTLNVCEVPTRCADNRMWAVCNNSSQPYSHWGTFVARPDTSIPKQLAMNQPGLLIFDFPDIQPKGEVYFNLQPMKLRDDEIMNWGAVSNHPRQRDGRSEP